MTRRRRSVPPAPSPDLGSLGVTTRSQRQKMAPSSPPPRPKPPSPPPTSATAASSATARASATSAAIVTPATTAAPAAAAAAAAEPARPPQQAAKHILAQADAIARMTIELNLRAVAAQADRLERELKALVECTARDRAFRDKHEQRLEDMWREMLAVKQRMGEFQARSAADVERCRAQTARAMDLLRGEAGRLRALVDDVGGALDRLSAGDSSQGEEAGGDREADEALKRRVRETLSSTRRWNRDHKTTSLGDPAFVARYLKQQSKRDPRMAVLIQRALQKRIARRGGGGGADGNSGNGNSSNAGNSSRRKARPQSLEQLCEDLVWKDVIETVEEVLVRAEAGVLRALR